MPLHATPSALILLFTSAIVSLTSLLIWRRRDVPAGRELFWLFSAVLAWSLAAALSQASQTVASAMFWARVEYLGSSSTAVFTLMFCLTTAHRARWRRPALLSALWALPVLVVALVVTNDWHHLIWTSVTPNPVPGAGHIFSHGPAYWLYIAYNYAYTLVGAYFLFREYVQSGPLYRRQTGAILFSMVFPWIGGMLYVLNWLPIPGLDITPVSFAFTAVIIAWATHSTRLLDLIPIAHSVLLQSMQDGVIVVDTRGRVVETNPAMAGLLGRLGLPIGETAAQTFRDWPSLVGLLAERPPLHSEISLPGDTERYLDVRLVSISGPRQSSLGQLAVLRDITRRKQAELALEARRREMEQQAITDDLTELFNRRYINTLLKSEFSRSLRYGLTFSVALIDIDDFKQINDRYGHQAGDDILRRVARVLETELRANDIAARLGGDEFMVVFPHTDLKGAFQVVDRVRNQIHQQIMTSDNMHISCSVGLTVRLPGDSQQTLLQRADRLLYDAKDQGRNRVIMNQDA